MGHVTAFSSHNFETVGYAVTDSSTAAFTLDAEEIYLIKAIRLTNYSTAGTTVDIKFYDGSSEFWVVKAKPVNAGCAVNAILDTPIVLAGHNSQEIRLAAADNSAIHAIITYMELGREGGL